MQLQTFSTEGTPAAVRHQLFQQEMQRRFSIGVAVKPTRNVPLLTEITTAYCGRRLRFASLHFSPHRTCPAVSASPPTCLLVTLHKEGTAHVSQGGRESRIEPGQMFMIDPARPFSIETSEIHTHSVYLQVDEVRAVVPHLDEFTARPIESEGNAGALFASMIDEMFRLTPKLDERIADSIADALPYVLAAALSAVGERSANADSRITALHKRRIQQFAREHLRNPDLDAQMVGDGVRLSLRRIYELCDSELPIMKWIWAERLERCRRDLGASPLMSRSIGAIAYSWGFSNLSHFSHAFRDRFGMSPRAWRKQALSGVAGPTCVAP